MNSVQIIGRLGADPEARYTESGKVIANIRIAVQRNKDVVDWISVTAFDKVAETIINYTKKGSQVGVNGRLQVDSWVDRESGANRSAVKIVVTGVTLLGSKNDKAAAEEGYDPSLDEF